LRNCAGKNTYFADSGCVRTLFGYAAIVTTELRVNIIILLIAETV